MKKRILRLVISLAAVYVAGGVLLYFFQDMLLFHPKPLPKDHRFTFDQPFEELNLDFAGNNLNIVKFKPAQTAKGIVLFYHGNMSNVEHYKQYPSFFTKNGYAVWMIDYPGFGKTTGKRSEEMLYLQALELYRLAAKEMPADRLIIYGKSIGTGIAAYVASKKTCKKLILETPYYSIDALAKHYFPIYPVMPLTSYSFPTHTYLQGLAVPVTILHGTDDEIIPFKQSKRLHEEQKTVELISITNGSHNDLARFPIFQQKLDSLLAN